MYHVFWQYNKLWYKCLQKQLQKLQAQFSGPIPTRKSCTSVAYTFNVLREDQFEIDTSIRTLIRFPSQQFYRQIYRHR